MSDKNPGKKKQLPINQPVREITRKTEPKTVVYIPENGHYIEQTNRNYSILVDSGKIVPKELPMTFWFGASLIGGILLLWLGFILAYNRALTLDPTTAGTNGLLVSGVVVVILIIVVLVTMMGATLKSKLEITLQVSGDDYN